MGSATMPSQRLFDDLLWDVMQTCLRHDLTMSVRQLVVWMQRDFPEYGLVPYRTLRHDIADRMHWAASRLYRLKLFNDDLKRGVPFDEAVKAAQDRPLKLNQDQFKKTLQRLCELLAKNPDAWPNTVARIVGPKNNCWPKSGARKA